MDYSRRARTDFVDVYVYLSSCLEGFLFGTISVLQLSGPLLKKSNTTPSQDSILAYSPCIYNTRKIPARPGQKIAFSTLYVLYIFYLLLPFPWIQQHL